MSVGSLTTVHEEQWNCIEDIARLVQIMDVESSEVVDGDVTSIHGQLVDRCFGLAPIEAVLPVGDKPFDVGERYAIFPSRLGTEVKLVR